MGTAASIQSKLFTTVGVGEIHFEGKCDDRRKSITVQSAVSIQVIKPDDKMSINNIKKDIILLHTSPLNDFVKTCFTQESRVKSLKALLYRSDFLLAFVNYASYDFDCRSRLSIADIRIVKRAIEHSNLNDTYKLELFKTSPLFDNFAIDTPRQPETFEYRHKAIYRNGALMVMVALRFLAGFRKGIYYKMWSDHLKRTGRYLDLALSRCLVEIDGEFDAEIDHCLRVTHEMDETSEYVNNEYIGTITDNAFLYQFIEAVECLPIGITISAVVPQQDNILSSGNTIAYSFPIVYANQMCSRLTGYTRSEILSKDIMTIPTSTLTSSSAECETDQRNESINIDLITSSKNTCKLSISDIGSQNYDVRKKQGFSSSIVPDVTNCLNYVNIKSSAVMSCCSNDGEKYDRMVGTKFMSNVNFKQAYVIAIHLDVTLELCQERNERLLMDLLSKLPDHVLNQ